MSKNKKEVKAVRINGDIRFKMWNEYLKSYTFQKVVGANMKKPKNNDFYERKEAINLFKSLIKWLENKKTLEEEK